VSKIEIDPKDAIYTSNDVIYAKKLLTKYRVMETKGSRKIRKTASKQHQE
jgi:hypothetical protein